MELRHLRYFVAVAEEMNIHRAAARLHISQPPLSLTIQQLEQEIGAALFTREGRGIQITRAGAIYLAHARKILADTDEAGAQARQSHQGVMGTLKIGFVSSTISGVLQETVTAFKMKYPGIVLDIRQATNSEIPRQLVRGEMDVGILRLPEALPDDLAVKEISQECWCVAIQDKHPLTKQTAVSVKDLKDKRLIFYPRWNNPAGYDDVISIFREHNIIPLIYQEAPEQMTIAALVASGMGIGLVPECMSRIKIPGVTHRPIRGTKNRTGFAFVSRKKEDVLVQNFLSMA